MTRRLLLGLAVLILAGVLAGCSSSSGASLLAGSSWPGITVYDDTIYMAFGPHLYAIDPQTADVLWRFPAEPGRGQTFYATPAVDDELIVVADYTDTLFAIDRTTGAQRWAFKSDRSRFIGGAVMNGKYVYAGTVDGQFHALRRENGKEAWTFSAELGIWSTPLLADDVLYVTSLDHHLYALDAQTGNLKWMFPAEGEATKLVGAMVGTPALYEGVLYFGTFSNRVYALKAATQTVVWTYETSNWIWSSPVIDEESGLLVGGDLDGHIFALDLETGTPRWTFDTDGPVVGTPVIDEKDGTRAVYATSGDSYLYVLGLENGRQLSPPISIEAEFTTRFLFVPTGTNIRPIPIYAPPILYEDLILIGAHQGNHPLIALDRETLAERWSLDLTKES